MEPEFPLEIDELFPGLKVKNVSLPKSAIEISALDAKSAAPSEYLGEGLPCDHSCWCSTAAGTGIGQDCIGLTSRKRPRENGTNLELVLAGTSVLWALTGRPPEETSRRLFYNLLIIHKPSGL